MALKKIATRSSPLVVRAKNPSNAHKAVAEWTEYFKKGELADWQRLMRDLGFQQEFSSKTSCCKVLKRVWVNICDFIDAVKHGNEVHFFRSQKELAEYTFANRKTYPKKCIPKGSPLRKLMAHVR